MTLKLTQLNHAGLCHGWDWTVEDEGVLAGLVARVAIGQYRHVARILAGTGVAGQATTEDHVRDAVSMLTVHEGEDPWHRDGWVFQTISWIAAHQSASGAAIRPPHLLKAHKGFDGMQLEVNSDGVSISAIVVFEDKATGDARDVIRDEVWPGIAALEAGRRVSELTQEASAMLEAQRHLYPALDIDTAISNVLWKEVRRYRVSITTGDTHTTEKARAGLFKGFDATAPGDVKRRRADTIYIPKLRAWMKNFSNRAIEQLKALDDNV